MGFFSKKKTTTTLEPMKESYQLEAGANLADWANTFIKKYNPEADYAGLSKMMTPTQYEQQGLNMLPNMANSQNSSLFKAGEAEILKTLNNEYDPTTSEYYKNTRKNIEKERQKAVKEANNMMAKYGLNQSSYKRGTMADINENTFDQVSTLLSTMAENERINKLNSAATAANMATTGQGLDMNNINALMTAGSLPRQLEAVGYEDFMRKQEALKDSLTVGQNVFATPIDYGQKSITTKSPSTFSKLIGPAVQAAGFGLAPFTGGASIPISQVVAPIATGASGGDVSSSSIEGLLSGSQNMDWSKIMKMFGSGSGSMGSIETTKKG